jgi:putative membrane protein
MNSLNSIRASVVYFDDFLVYFLLALLVFVIFTWVYMKSTPYRELELIRGGNTAAAITLSGAMIGFTLPLASVVANSVNIVDMLLFAVLAGVVQVIVFVVGRTILPGLPGSIEDGNVAKATLIAAMSICVGLLNAAALTY